MGFRKHYPTAKQAVDGQTRSANSAGQIAMQRQDMAVGGQLKLIGVFTGIGKGQQQGKKR